MIKGNNKAGFTLVELAIVLVIIGLIVGGVLVGQDLIKAASIRSSVTDIEKYNAAATTFRGKYNGLPGDLVNTKATEFGFGTGAGRTGGAGLGDGNGLLEGGSAVLTTNVAGENAYFWADLGGAGLVPMRSSYNGAQIGVTTGAATNAILGGSYLPKTKLRDSNLVTVFSTAGRNYYGMGTLTTADAAGTLATAAGLSPLEGRGIDEKLDDGMPLTGTVTAISAFSPTGTTIAAAVAAGNAGCVATSGTNSVYNASTDALLNAVACSLSIRSSF